MQERKAIKNAPRTKKGGATGTILSCLANLFSSGLSPSVREFHPLSFAGRRSWTVTTGMELHQTPKIFNIIWLLGLPHSGNPNNEISLGQ